MTSHIHMIIASINEKPENIVRDMKSYTSTQLKKAISENQQESRKECLPAYMAGMLEMMYKAGEKNGNNDGFQFNPVEAGIVDRPEDYLYSSARDFAGCKGLIDICYFG